MITKIITVNNNCLDCPFCSSEFDSYAMRFPFRFDCSLGEYLNLEDSTLDLREDDELDQDITPPEWCPLKTTSIQIRLDKP